MVLINNRLRTKLRLSFWRWHRRLGLIAAFFVILLAITGILLNHTATLSLDDTTLSVPLVSTFYSVDLPAPVSFEAGNSLFTQWGKASIHRNGSPLLDCRGELVGAVFLDQYEVLACAEELVLVLEETGEVVERIAAAHGLPSPVQAAGICGSALCLRSAYDDLYRVDLDALTWTQLSDTHASSVRWSAAVPTPEPVRRDFARHHLGQTISWERFLLDLHSGRIVGGWGVWLMDIMALFFLVLAITGVAVWTLGRRTIRRSSKSEKTTRTGERERP